MLQIKAKFMEFFCLFVPQFLSMKFFIDTANLDQIKEAQELGVLDGVALGDFEGTGDTGVNGPIGLDPGIL